jgi:acyl dehydratase
MELSSSFVGSVSKALKTRVSPRHAMNFAASVGDSNPYYFDDENEDQLIAPPMLAVALIWPIASRIQEYWEREDFPEEVLRQKVHFTETLVWHQPLRHNDELTVVGKLAAIFKQRGGTMLVTEFKVTNEAHEPVFTEYVGVLLRRVRCPGAGAGAEDLPVVPMFDGDGPPVWEEKMHIDPLAAHVFDAGADVPFEIHTSQRFAKQVGLPRTIFQGAGTLAMAVRELVNREADGNPNRLAMVNCRFTGMVFPGSDITMKLLGRHETDEGTGLHFEILNDQGRKALSEGYVKLSR